MTGMVIEKLFLADAQKVSGEIERKITACGLINLACDCAELINGKYQQYWGKIIEATIRLFELPQDESLFTDDHYIEVDDTPTFEQGFSKLSYAREAEKDPLAKVTDARQYLAVKLGQLNAAFPNQLSTILSTLDQQYQIAVKDYMTKFNVPVA